MAGMFEFAGILLLQRRNRSTRGNRLTENEPLPGRGSFEIDDLTTKIDMIALTWFSLSYIVFNVGYWTANLTTFDLVY